jgi:hypothetical protein
MAKETQEIDVLLYEAKKVAKCYEDYLLDKTDWRELAKIMKILVETIETIEKKRKK